MPRFVFLVHRVHDESLRHLSLVVTKSVRLLQESVDEGGFCRGQRER